MTLSTSRPYQLPIVSRVKEDVYTLYLPGPYHLNVGRWDDAIAKLDLSLAPDVQHRGTFVQRTDSFVSPGVHTVWIVDRDRRVPQEGKAEPAPGVE
jgi:hypothetical protein